MTRMGPLVNCETGPVGKRDPALPTRVNHSRTVEPQVCIQVLPRGERRLAVLALVWLHDGVAPLVNPEAEQVAEDTWTHQARERPVLRVRSPVPHQLGLAREGLVTEPALVTFPILVDANVICPEVLSGEEFQAEPALVGPFGVVFLHVCGE